MVQLPLAQEKRGLSSAEIAVNGRLPVGYGLVSSKGEGTALCSVSVLVCRGAWLPAGGVAILQASEEAAVLGSKCVAARARVVVVSMGRVGVQPREDNDLRAACRGLPSVNDLCVLLC